MTERLHVCLDSFPREEEFHSHINGTGASHTLNTVLVSLKLFSLKMCTVCVLVISLRVLSQKNVCFVYNTGSSDVEGIKSNHLYSNNILKVLF